VQISPATTTSDTSLNDLKTCTLTSTFDSASPLQHHDVRSTYHIYHKREQHATISPTTNPSKERYWGPTIKENKAKRQRKKEEIAAAEANGLTLTESRRSAAAEEVDDGSFFLHTPYLAFHDPPRVLYTGTSKHTVPAVLIHSSAFWHTWKLQLGPSIGKPGVLDPRGVVCWKHNGGDDKALEKDDKLLKGYKVRTWRLWGETGKDYVHNVKTSRDTGTGPDPDIVQDETPVQKEGEDPETESTFSSFDEGEGPARAEEVVYLKWTSPFSKNTRRYHFQYAGVDFYWKGTGTVKETRKCGFFLHWNHLKLVAVLPEQDKDDIKREICLGKYTSSIASKKSGKLELFDGAIWRLMEQYMPSVLEQVQPGERPPTGSEDDQPTAEQMSLVKKTSLYQVIVATAMCMIIGEKQKRDTIRQIIEAAAGEGGGGGN
jgi:hypothetical protein